MEAFEEMMTSPEMKEWDKENNYVDIVYSLEKSISHLTPQILGKD